MKGIPTIATPSSMFRVRGSTLNSVLNLLLLLAASAANAATRYVWQGSPSPAPPYTSWASAVHVIQEAVDAAQTGDTVWVAGGV